MTNERPNERPNEHAPYPHKLSRGEQPASTAKYLENPRYTKAYFLRICVIFSEFRGKSNL